MNSSSSLSPLAAGRLWLKRLWWNLIYLLGHTPWDTGITPPEVRAVVESGQVKPGRALDLGCGSGTNVLYLAQHGFEVVGVDISSRAVTRAQRKVKQAGLEQNARIYAGSAIRLDSLPINGLFDLVLDIGCLHAIDASARQDYAHGIIKRMRPGGLYMLYAFIPCVKYGWRMGISGPEVRALFSPGLALQQESHGRDKNGGGVESVWYIFFSSAPHDLTF